MRRYLFTSVSVRALAGALAVLPLQAQAQNATALPPVQVETERTGLSDASAENRLDGKKLYSQQPGVDDTAALLRSIPGVEVYQGGGVSSLPYIRGFADDRLRTSVDGMDLSSACPNHMNPALSYVDPSRVGSIEVWSGISPVSVGGDNIGGTVVVKSAPPVFAQPGAGYTWGGSLSARYRSVNDGIGGSANLHAATETYSLGYIGSWNKGRDYYAGGDHSAIHSTLYDSRNHAATLAAQHEGQKVTVQGGQQFIPYEGFANQRMDLTNNRSLFFNGGYEGEFGWGKLEAKAYWQSVNHYMNILQSERWGNMPMGTKAYDAGYELKADIVVSKTDHLRLGNELHGQRLDDWWPPVVGSMMMSPNTYKSINNGSRDRYSTYAEWEAGWTPQWTTLLGVRNDTVVMNTGNVQAYGTSGMNATDFANSQAFNARDRHKTDINFDMTALVRFEPNAISSNEFGYARKSRSPNLYERYAWGTQQMDSSMINWFGDANSYVGDIDLKPEVAHTVSASFGLHDQAKSEWSAKLTPYVSYVVDYIGVDYQRMYTTRGSNFPLLKFANHDALLYGVDFSGGVGLWESAAYGKVGLKGNLGWTRGEQVNTGKGLYHVMPINAKATVEHKLDGWTNAVELSLVGAKTAVDNTRLEPRTAGYALVNLRSGYDWENVSVNLGIENLFDKRYYHPLGGVDIADWAYTRQNGQIGALAAPGRSFNAGVTVRF